MKVAVQFLLIVLANFSFAASKDDYKVVCYYTNWAQYRTENGGVAKFFPSDINPTLCTHINYAFAVLNGTKLKAYEWNDEDTDWSRGMFSRVQDAKEINPSVKILLSVGGWNMGSTPFSAMVATKDRRTEFVKDSISYLRSNGFDGLDLDWEYPTLNGGRPEDKANFAALTKELSMAYAEEAEQTDSKRLLLTAAVAAGKDKIDASYDVPAVAKHLDFINLMTYDLHGSWEATTGLNAPLYPRANETQEEQTLNVEFAANYWVQLGAPKSKLVIGMPFYGRSFTLTDKSNFGLGAPANDSGEAGPYLTEKGFSAYFEICERLKSPTAKRYWSEEQQCPYMVDGNQWIGYDDEMSIAIKTNWLMKEGFAGAMVWALDLDSFKLGMCGAENETYPLLRTVTKTLSAGIDHLITRPIPSTKRPVVTGSTNSERSATSSLIESTEFKTTKHSFTTLRQPKTSETTTKQATRAVPTPRVGYVSACNGRVGLFADSKNCKIYHHCDTHRREYIRRCGTGTFFNPRFKVCDWPYNVRDCDKQGMRLSSGVDQLVTRLIPSSIPASTKRPAATDFKSSAAATRSAVTVTSAIPTNITSVTNITSTANITSAISANTSMSSMSNATTFAELWSTTMALIESNEFSTTKDIISQSTLFTTSSQPATLENTTTQATRAVPTSSTTKQVTRAVPTPRIGKASLCNGQVGRFADLKNCRIYHDCDTHGREYIRPCPTGLFFNSQLKVCDWPNDVRDCNKQGMKLSSGVDQLVTRFIPSSIPTSTKRPAATDPKSSAAATRSAVTVTSAIPTNITSATNTTSSTNITSTNITSAISANTSMSLMSNATTSAELWSTTSALIESNEFSTTKDIISQSTLFTTSSQPATSESTTTHATRAAPTSSRATQATRAAPTSSRTKQAPRAAPTPRIGYVSACNGRVGLFANTKNCKIYHHCDTHKREYIKRCGTGTFFNARLKVCDWPYNVRDCNKRGVRSSKFVFG